MTPTLPVWLFVSYGGGHVKALLPVAQRVKAQGLAEPVYLALTTARDAVRASGIRTIGFSDFLRAEDGEARRHGAALVAGLQVQAADVDESCAYLGLSYADMAQRLGEAEAASRYQRFGRQAFHPSGVLARVLEELKPALVVATNSPRAERAAIEAARAAGIPSCCLVDLLGLWERDVLAQPGYADAVCVLNEGVRHSIVGAGRRAAEVHVTGNPAFDTINDKGLVEAGRWIRQEAGWDGLHVCLYASSPEPLEFPGIAGRGDPEFPRRIERALREAVEANPALALWIRRHPSEASADDVAALRHPRIRVSTRDMPLHAAIHASDEVIVTVSTVGVEAQLAGKSVTQVRGSILDYLSPYVAMGIAGRELRVDQIDGAFAAAGPRPATGEASALSLSGGNATQRVVDVLQSLAEKHRAG